jgi:F-type H+-transporting ATPase subunit epsilon
MAQKTFTLDIVSAQETIFSGEVTGLIVTGSQGELGIMPGHTQLLTEIKPGQITYKTQDGDGEKMFYVSGGMLEVQPFVATIMADTVLRAEDIDEQAALEAQERARVSLANKDGSQVDKDVILAQMAESAAQLRVFKELQKLRH